MKISTIIPVYNAGKYISRCLDSILSQGIEAQEIICVDDGSTDNSLEILRKYEEAHSNIHVLTQQNCYAGIARNNGLTIATGEYVHFMDADDYVLPDAYAKVYETAKINSADYVKTRSKTFDMQTGLLTENKYFSMSGFPENIYGKLCSLMDCQDVLLQTARAPWTSFVKRSYLEEHNIKFNSLKCEHDRSFYIDVIMHTDKIIICDCYMVCYQINNKNSLMGIRDENFICLIKSYQFIKDMTPDMPRKLRKKVLTREFNCLAGQYTKLDTACKKKAQKLLSPFLKSFILNDLDESFLTISAANLLYTAKGIEFPYEYRIKNLTILNEHYTHADKIILYGAGQVCLMLLQYLVLHNYNLGKIFGIVVSDTICNPDNVMSIPVYSIEEYDLSSIDEIIIATFENVQLPIYRKLLQNTSCNIWGLSNDLCALLGCIY